MKLIERKNIDTKKWDAAIANSPIENIFQYSWYLDAVCKNWAGLITEDYKTVFPVPYTKKLQVKQFIQAPFTREYNVVGTDFTLTDAIQFLATKFKSVHFRSDESTVLKNRKKRTHQWLNLNGDFQKEFSTNAKRILKKSLNFEIKSSTDSAILIELFKTHVAHKIETISKHDLVSLTNLMNVALKNKCGHLLVVVQDRKIVAGGFFLTDKSRITYLKGASEETAKKNGSMYFLLDFAMNHFKNKYTTFDFGGSDIEKVAEFYHKFGAKDRVYYDYKIDDLPFWFKALKKLKR